MNYPWFFNECMDRKDHVHALQDIVEGIFNYDRLSCHDGPLFMVIYDFDTEMPALVQVKDLKYGMYVKCDFDYIEDNDIQYNIGGTPVYLEQHIYRSKCIPTTEKQDICSVALIMSAKTLDGKTLYCLPYIDYIFTSEQEYLKSRTYKELFLEADFDAYRYLIENALIKINPNNPN